MADASGSYYPPAGFYFRVKFSGFRGKYDGSFQEVSGITMERNVTEITEGGENRFVHRVPDRARYGNLVLKRGLVVATSDLATWCRNALGADLGKPIKPHDLDVQLLDGDASPLMQWSFVGAWPVKWNTSDLNARANEIVVSSLEFAFSYFTTS